MQYYYCFNVSKFFDEEFFDNVLVFLVDNNSLKQKEIVKKIGIPHATFARAKAKGFSKNKNVLTTLKKYFGIKDYSFELKESLNEQMNKLFTFIYFNNAEKQQECFLELMKLYEKTKGTILEVLNLMLISISMNTSLYPDNKNVLDLIEEKIPLINYLFSKIDSIGKYILIYSEWEYASHKKDYSLMVKYGTLIEPLISFLPEKLQVMADFVVMNNCFFTKDNLKGIIFANKVIEAQHRYFSPVIRTTAVYALTTFYSILKDFDKVIDTAENEVLYLQFDEEHQLQYFAMVSSLICAYIVKKDYQKSKDLVHLIQSFKLEEHPLINKSYYPVLASRQKISFLYELFISYCEKDSNIETIKNIISSFNSLEMNEYVLMIELLNKKNKTSIKKLGKLIELKMKTNLLLGYSNIFFLINEEYQKVLRINL